VGGPPRRAADDAGLPSPATYDSPVTLERLTGVSYFTEELLEDAAAFGAQIEYSLLGGADVPLTLRERVTGWRAFTSSGGYTIVVGVGWRTAVWRARATARRRLHDRLSPHGELCDRDREWERGPVDE
jgi:hypothetical protein